MIEKNGVLLRAWKIEDAERLAQIANNKKIYDHLRDGFPHPYTLDDALVFIDNAQKNLEKSRLFAIVTGNEVVGSIGVFFKEDVYRLNAEIGYFLAETHWGQGIMSKAVAATVEYVFDHYDIIRISAEPFAGNMGSRKVLEKAGFKLDAYFKKSIIKNNVVGDSCIYSKLRSDFDEA